LSISNIAKRYMRSQLFTDLFVLLICKITGFIVYSVANVSLSIMIIIILFSTQVHIDGQFITLWSIAEKVTQN